MSTIPDDGSLVRFLVVQERARYHEAGHAVVACLMGYRLTRITVLTREDLAMGRSGKTHYEPRIYTLRSRRATIEKAIKVALAGGIAERMACRGAQGGDEQDMVEAKFYAQYLRRSLRCDWLSRLRGQTRSLLLANWPAVERVADMLQWEEGELTKAKLVNRVLGGIK